MDLIPPQRFRVFPLFIHSVTRLARYSLSTHLRPNRLGQGQCYISGVRHYATRDVAGWVRPINQSTAGHVRKKQVSSFSIRFALDTQLPFASCPPKSDINYDVAGGMVTDPLRPSIPPRCGIQQASTNSMPNPHREQRRGRSQINDLVRVGFVWR